MASTGANDDEWHIAHPATEILEEKQIEEWERSKTSWSGAGKHPTNWTDYKAMKVRGQELGRGSFGKVELITYKTVTMARKRVKPKGWHTIEKLREEANAMERLVHKHILRLVGTYTFKHNNLFLLLYPAAVCDLEIFLEEVDDIYSGEPEDREDAINRPTFKALGIQNTNTIEELASKENHTASISRTATTVGFLQQILGCITEAVAFMHAQDIRHKDLKPKNILLSPGRVYLADFGISHDVKGYDETVTNDTRGTPHWIAPEVHDEAGHHLAAADVWSLGCIFLNVVTVVYTETLEAYEMTMKVRDCAKKYEMLPKYLHRLKTKANAAALEDPEAPNFNFKHIVGLIDDMLKRDPNKRPTANQVNERLSELGGLDQIYHLACCHKKNIFVSKIINRKLQSVLEMNADSARQIAQLKAENEQYKARIASLEENKETWARMSDKAVKHIGDQCKVLQEKYSREVEARTQLEERLKAFEKKPPRRPRSQNRGRGKSQGLIHVNGNLPPKAFAPRPPLPNGRSSEKLSVNVARRNRTSGLPVPTRPATPIRPAMDRDPGSSSSTLVSSVHSTFSRASVDTQDSFSSVGSARTVSPGSPTRRKSRSSENMEPPTSQDIAKETTKPASVVEKPGHATKPSWANLFSRSSALA